MGKAKFLLPILILLSGILCAFSSPALADDDPPGRVARLNFIQGSISFQPGGETDWVQANPNRPLTTGDNLWADRDSRGELHIGSTSLRIGSQTGISFLNLDDRTVQIQLAQGTLNVHVRRLEGGDAFEIDTPNLAFTLERAGEYRVDVDPNGNATTITVRSGEGDATGGGSEYHMDSGDEATYTGTDSLTYDGGQAGRFDDFDEWCRSRDDREERAQSARYVSRDVIGYDDLDDYGDWRNVPDYGYVWFPRRVGPGWAPYRNGHWAWIAPWGWTWVEDEPWGFAPFHYGRWAEFDGGWCWVPGPMIVRPVYAPALVVFVGGPRFGVSLSFGGGGGMAWFPLGPREVYVPPYRTSERYVQRVNVTNTTVNVVNVTNVYNNVNVTNIHYMHQNNIQAVTAVSHDTFVNARPVAAANVRVNPQQMQAAEVQRNFTVAPERKSVVGAGAPASVKPPAAVMQRQVVAKETPPPPRAPVNDISPRIRTFGQGGATPQQPGQPQIQQRGQQAPPQIQQQQQQHPIQQQQQTQQPQQQPQMQQQQRTIQPPQQAGQPQIQQRGQQSQPPQIQQQQQHPMQQQQQIQQAPPRPQTEQARPAPAPANPQVRYAPPARATEDTYHPHQFEKAPAAPQQAAPQPRTQNPPPREPERGQESKKPENEKERK